MRKTQILLVSLLSMLMIVSSCKKEDPIVEADELVKYVEANIPVKTLPSYVGVTSSPAAKAETLNDLLLTGGAYVIDIRSESVYGTGHIAGAVNVDISTGASVIDYVVENEATIGTKKIVIVCYSGQSAAWVGALLKLSGFSNTATLKFGMSGWSDDFDSWEGKYTDNFAQMMETTSNPVGPEVGLPTVNTGFETGEEILAARIKAVEAAGFGAIATTNQAAFDNSGSWYIMNYWKPDHYNWGHIPGAIMFDPTAEVNPFTTAADLETIPVDGTGGVVYCYTGQTSAWVTTYLQVLGYTNVKSLKFGMNGMAVSTMPGTTWPGYRDSHVLTNAVE